MAEWQRNSLTSQSTGGGVGIVTQESEADRDPQPNFLLKASLILISGRLCGDLPSASRLEMSHLL